SVRLDSFGRFDDYIGREGENSVCESIVTEGPEVIGYQDGRRQSLIQIAINGGEYV
ncbi:MAG: hypothetical protein HRT35_34755, partial [Algicola sp.]|nr:hypothetical protein [Algicola sp.]